MVAAMKLRKLGEVISSKELSHTLEISKENQGKVMAYLTDNFEVDDIDVKSIPLDEIIEDLFNKTT